MSITNPAQLTSQEPQAKIQVANVYDAESPALAIEDTQMIFQAIGVIVGEVDIDTEGKITISIGNYKYPLLYIKEKYQAFEILKKEIEVTDKHAQKLIVYPTVFHSPKKEQPYGCE